MMMDDGDISITGNPWVDGLIVLAGIIFLVIAGAVIHWLLNRYIAAELNLDACVSADDPVRIYYPGEPGNPTIVTYLELQFPQRISSVMMIHRVGATVAFTDGTMQMFTRSGRPIDEPFDPDQYRGRLVKR